MPLAASQNETGVTIVVVPHNNVERLKIRLERDLFPTIAAHPNWKFQLVLVNNSDTDEAPVSSIPEQDNLEYNYFWPGTNLMYGPAMNLAIKASVYPYLVYICSNHGHMYDPSWIDDLVNPMRADNKIAMTGSYYQSGDPSNMGFPAHLPQIHIQGGVFGARTEALREFPYTTDPRWVHWGSDIFQCFQLIQAGLKLHNVMTIKSVWRESLHSPEQWKYVHDHSE
jgi:hypothetical protein